MENPRSVVKQWFHWFRNPHFAPAAVLARVGVNAGTLIWGIVVLSREHALDGSRFIAYAFMLKVFHEDVWAYIAIFIAVTGLFRLLIKARPNWIFTTGYFGMMAFWNWFAWSLLVDYSYPLSPSTVAGIIVLAGFSIYAFASNPKAASHAADLPNQ